MLKLGGVTRKELSVELARFERRLGVRLDSVDERLGCTEMWLGSLSDDLEVLVGALAAYRKEQDDQV